MIASETASMMAETRKRKRTTEAAAVAAQVRALHDADGWLFRQELVDCGRGATGRCRKCANGPGHGPYWYGYRWHDGRMQKRYVGKRLPESVAVAQSVAGTGAEDTGKGNARSPRRPRNSPQSNPALH